MRLRVQEFRQLVELESFHKCAKVSYGVLTSVSWRVKGVCRVRICTCMQASLGVRRREREFGEFLELRSSFYKRKQVSKQVFSCAPRRVKQFEEFSE